MKLDKNVSDSVSADILYGRPPTAAQPYTPYPMQPLTFELKIGTSVTPVMGTFTPIFVFGTTFDFRVIEPVRDRRTDRVTDGQDP